MIIQILQKAKAKNLLKAKPKSEKRDKLTELFMKTQFQNHKLPHIWELYQAKSEFSNKKYYLLG